MGCGLSKEQGLPQPVPQPAAQGPSDAADPISQGLGDAQQAVGLIDGIYQLAGPAILQAQQKRNERDALKQKIGPWWDQAFERGACRIPVLVSDHFENHLKKANGILTPQGTCTADSPWGYLLHALAINPQDNVLSWKPATGASWDMKGQSLALDVRGRAFCHLINLYRIETLSPDVASIDGKHQQCTHCHLLCGWLDWTSIDTGHVLARFEADTFPKLNIRKKPLGYMSTDFHAFFGERFWDRYQDTCARGKGVSDASMLWPNPQDASLAERLESLVSNLRKVETCRDGLLISEQWLAAASSIKKRATTNGGKDDSFLRDAYRTWAEHPARKNVDAGQNQSIQSQIKACFFFSDDHFVVLEMNFQASPPSGYRSDLVRKVLDITLESYDSNDVASWKGQLYAAKEAVLEVLLAEPVVFCSAGHVRVLDFAGDPLWDARVHI